MEDFKRLIDCIRKEEVTLFLGSGFSLKAGAPSASRMVDTIINEMPEEEQERLKVNKQLDTIAEEYQEMYDRDKLLCILENLMSFKRTDMSDYECLKKIPHIHHIITTNYDTLIEDAYGEDYAYVVRTTEDCTKIPKNKVIIFKIHGDFKCKENIIITKDDYTNFFSNQKESLLWKYIQSKILTTDVLFIGYSLEDPNIFEIMKDIKKAVNGNNRQFYLVAPGLKDYKINRLAKTNVIYYNSKAEDLFPYIFSSLDKNICRDYKKKRISLTTLSKYSNNKNLDPIASEGEKCNKVHFAPKGPIEILFNGLIDKDLNDRLADDDPSLYTEVIPNTFIPAIKLGRDRLKNLDVKFNGMTVGTRDDIPCIYLSPDYEQKKVSFRIPEIGFNEKASITQFKIKNCVTIISKLECFTLKFEYTLKQDNSIDCYIRILFLDKYKNNSEALKWIELLIAIMDGKELIISSMPKMPIKKTIKEDNLEMKCIRQYYRNIKDIEMLYDVEFKEYNNFSVDALKKTEKLIYSYNESIICLNIKCKEFTLEEEKDMKSIDDQLLIKNKLYNITISYYPESIELNGHIFKLKNKHVIIPNCTILSIEQKDNKSLVSIRVNNDNPRQIYTNEDINKKQFKNIN